MVRMMLRAKGQLTLPEDIRNAAHLEEGDLIEIEITEDGILLRPQKLIDSTQAWFWEAAWQSAERDADADDRAGRVELFESGEALIDGLRAMAKPTRPRPRPRR